MLSSAKKKVRRCPKNGTKTTGLVALLIRKVINPYRQLINRYITVIIVFASEPSNNLKPGGIINATKADALQ
jgi:hypothetical protein